MFMNSSAAPRRRATRLALWLCLLLSAISVSAQQPQPTPVESDEVIRVSTELVQTDVVVFDKQGQFVDNLRAEDFELRVDSKPQTISFFERVKAGSINEEAQLAAARGGRNGTAAGNAEVRPLDRGRSIFFFIDDLHLSIESLRRTQGVLTHFVEGQVGQNDQVAIVTASGQVGFLQQLTDEKQVLREAISRIAYRERTVRDNIPPLMTALDAVNIQRNDQITVDAFVEAVMRELPGITRAQAEEQVHSRADQIVALNNVIAAQTLGGLQNLIKLSAQLPGRKLVYFISDGFVINNNETDTQDRIRRVTDAALRAGVVVYTLDAHGLSTGAVDMADTGFDTLVDRTGQIRGTSAGVLALQDPLRIIAADTGGRALLNTNALTNAITKALQETSIYYMLAWRPAQEELRGGKFRRIEVGVRARPDLTVLVQRGFFNTPPPDAPPRKNADRHKRADHANDSAPTGAQSGNVLVETLNSFAPKTALPTALTLNYIATPRGLMLASTMQVNVEPPPPGQGRQIDLLGIIYDTQGRVASSFQRRATLPPTPATAPPTAASAEPLHLVVTLETPLKPGLYQVRVAAHEVESGRAGSAAQWITIPALDDGKLALSSIFLGTRPETTAATAPVASNQPQALVSPERRFARNSVIRFVLYIYNTARNAAAAPDVALQIQVFRDDQPVITAPLRKVAPEGLIDNKVLPYAAEVELKDLPIGRYILQLTAIDRIAKTSASQRVRFTIE
jgi:VWFA-related protein